MSVWQIQIKSRGIHIYVTCEMNNKNLSNKARERRMHVVQYINIRHMVWYNCPRPFRLFRLLFPLPIQNREQKFLEISKKKKEKQILYPNQNPKHTPNLTNKLTWKQALAHNNYYQFFNTIIHKYLNHFFAISVMQVIGKYKNKRAHNKSLINLSRMTK